MSVIKSKVLSQMDKDIWVENLRSGQYKQGQDLLCDRHKNYCCLGVLAQQKNILKHEKDIASCIQGDLQELYNIPYEILELDIQNILVQLNDNFKLSFKQIASFIDRFIDPKDD